MEREMFHWTVTLQRNDGEVREVQFKTFWDPNAEDSAREVQRAAMATMNARAKGAGLEQRFAPLKAERMGPGA